MQIGDLLTHNDRRYLLRGFDPQSAVPRLVYIEDLETGARVALPFDDLQRHWTRSGRGLRLVRPLDEELHKDLP